MGAPKITADTNDFTEYSKSTDYQKHLQYQKDNGLTNATDPTMWSAFNDWRVALHKGNAAATAYRDLAATEPGRDATILAAGKNSTILGR